jgi:hypothetical protein
LTKHQARLLINYTTVFSVQMNPHGTSQESAESIIGFLEKRGFLHSERGVQQTLKHADSIRADELTIPRKTQQDRLSQEGIARFSMQEDSTMQEQRKKEAGDSRKRPRPVLMIPLRRCGSHALRLRLNVSPDFYAPYPLHLVDFMPLVKLYGDLGDDKKYFQMILDLIGLQTVSMVKWPDVVFDPVEVFESIKDEPRSVHRVLWELLFQAGAKRGARVVMDKSLDSVHAAEELTALFDDMLFLNVVRDPRAQISSMNRAIIHDFDTFLNAMTWVRAYKAGKKLAMKYPDNVLTIRYEDFVSNQEAVLRKICAFFGIAFLPAMLDISRSQEAQKISVLSALWESNNKAPIPAHVDKFKKTLSADEIEIIETVTGEYMDYYGYERMTLGKAAITSSTIAAAKKRSESNKKKAWADLEKNDNRDFQLRKFRSDYLDMVRNRLQQRKTAQDSVAIDDLAVAWSNHVKPESDPHMS